MYRLFKECFGGHGEEFGRIRGPVFVHDCAPVAFNHLARIDGWLGGVFLAVAIVLVFQSNKYLRGAGYVLAGLGFLFLGIHHMKVELEELGFQALYPLRADRISRAVASSRGNRKELVAEILPGSTIADQPTIGFDRVELFGCEYGFRQLGNVDTHKRRL